MNPDFKEVKLRHSEAFVTKLQYPSLEEFLKLPTEEVADIVRASGSKVVVFPINGTRRWFMLEYGNREFEDPIAAYMDIAQTRHVELYRLFFDHGVETLITPIIGAEILATRNAYMQKIGGEGLARLASHPEFLEFYEKHGVRVRFYGDYRKNLMNSPYEFLLDLFDEIIFKTRHNNRFRLFFGAFADNLNSTNIVAEYSVKYFKQHGRVPTREEIVSMYYGDYVEKVNIFIGFDRFAVFDYPLINWGEEDLYFMISPSAYLTSKQLREILYDHIFTRRALEVEYISLPSNALKRTRKYYLENREFTMGIGQLLDGTWVPRLNKHIKP